MSPTRIYLGLLGDAHIVGPWARERVGTEKRKNNKTINQTSKQMELMDDRRTK